MPRAFAAFIGSAVLLVAGQAAAGPCEQLAGARWLFYLEGRSPAHVQTGFMDFRNGVSGGLIYKAHGAMPLPTGAHATPLPHGQASWVRISECITLPGNIARLGFPVAMDVTVAADGKSFVMTGSLGGGQGQSTGWAIREPERSFAQRQRN